jgi:hypothetical protein
VGHRASRVDGARSIGTISSPVVASWTTAGMSPARQTQVVRFQLDPHGRALVEVACLGVVCMP